MRRTGVIAGGDDDLRYGVDVVPRSRGFLVILWHAGPAGSISMAVYGLFVFQTASTAPRSPPDWISDRKI